MLSPVRDPLSRRREPRIRTDPTGQSNTAHTPRHPGSPPSSRRLRQTPRHPGQNGNISNAERLAVLGKGPREGPGCLFIALSETEKADGKDPAQQRRAECPKPDPPSSQRPKRSEGVGDLWGHRCRRHWGVHSAEERSKLSPASSRPKRQHIKRRAFGRFG